MNEQCGYDWTLLDRTLAELRRFAAESASSLFRYTSTTPTGPIVEGSIAPVINDPARLLPAKEQEQ